MKAKFRNLKKIAVGLMIGMLTVSSPVGVVFDTGTIVAEAASKKVALNKTKVSVQKGKTYKLTLKNVKTGTKVKWFTSKKSVATVKASGTSCVVTGKKAGTATITAKVGKKSYKCKVTVKNPPVTLSAKSQTLVVGKSFNLSLQNTKSSVKWSTSNKKVATIKKVSKYKYKVTAKKAGTATITAKVGKKSYKCKVTVKPLVSSVSVSGGNTITVGQTTQLSATLSPKGCTGGVTWVSSNKGVATVSNTGLVKGIKAGTVRITATATDGSKKSGSVSVTVKAAPAPSKPNKPSTPQTEPTRPAETETEPAAPIKPVEKPKPEETEPPKPIETESERPVETETERQPETEAAYVSVSYNCEPEIYVGDSTYVALNSNRSILISSSSNCIKVEDLGLMEYRITGVSAGSATITFSTPEGVSTSVRVAVKEKEEPAYVNIVSGAGRTITVGDSCSIVVDSNKPVSYSISGSYVTASMSGSTLTVKGVSAGTASITFTAGNASTTTTVTVKDPSVEFTAGQNETVAGGRECVITCVLPVASNPSVSLSNDNVEISGYNLSGSTYTLRLIGRRAGTTNVTVSVGGISGTASVTVTSTDEDFYGYRNWMDGLIRQCGYGSKEPIEVLKNLGAWLVDNRCYDAGSPTYQQLYREGSGADCFGYTDLFVDVATRYFNFNAYRSPDQGHIKAIVEINGVKWGLDAGTNGPAGSRDFSIVSSEGEGYNYYQGVWR